MTVLLFRGLDFFHRKTSRNSILRLCLRAATTPPLPVLVLLCGTFSHDSLTPARILLPNLPREISMSLQQRNIVWDWAQGAPPRSRLHGLGVSLRLHTGRTGGLLSASLFDGTDRTRLWSMRAEMPLAKPSKTCFTVERAWQVPTTVTRC